MRLSEGELTMFKAPTAACEVQGLLTTSNSLVVPLILLAICSLSIIKDTICLYNEIHTENCFQYRAIVSFAAKNIKKINRCLEQWRCSIDLFSRAIQGCWGNKIPETFQIKAKTLFQNPHSFGHSHHV